MFLNVLVLQQFEKTMMLKSMILQHFQKLKQWLKHLAVDIFKIDVAETNTLRNISFGHVVKPIVLAAFSKTCC